MPDLTPLAVKTRATLQGIIQAATDMKAALENGDDILPNLVPLEALIHATIDELIDAESPYADAALRPGLNKPIASNDPAPVVEPDPAPVPATPAPVPAAAVEDAPNV